MSAATTGRRRPPPPALRSRAKEPVRRLPTVNVFEDAPDDAVCCLASCNYPGGEPTRARWRVTFAQTGGQADYCGSHAWPHRPKAVSL